MPGRVRAPQQGAERRRVERPGERTPPGDTAVHHRTQLRRRERPCGQREFGAPPDDGPTGRLTDLLLDLISGRYVTGRRVLLPAQVELAPLQVLPVGRGVIVREVRGILTPVQQRPRGQPAHRPLLVGRQTQPVEEHVQLGRPDVRAARPREAGAQRLIGIADGVVPVGEHGRGRPVVERLPHGPCTAHETVPLERVDAVDPRMDVPGAQQRYVVGPPPARGVAPQPLCRRQPVRAAGEGGGVREIDGQGEPGAAARGLPDRLHGHPAGAYEHLLGHRQGGGPSVARGLGNVRHRTDLGVFRLPGPGPGVGTGTGVRQLPGRLREGVRQGRGRRLRRPAHPDPQMVPALVVPDEEPPTGLAPGDEPVEERSHLLGEEGVDVLGGGAEEAVEAEPGGVVGAVGHGMSSCSGEVVGGRRRSLVGRAGFTGTGAGGGRVRRGAPRAAHAPAGTAPPAAGRARACAG